MDEPDCPPSLPRRLLPWLSVIVLAAALCDGVIFYGRWSHKREGERERAAQEAARNRKVAAMVGGDSLKILAFYASPGTVRRGKHTTICYGVNDARTVRLEPPVDGIWPAFTRCVQVSPHQNTDYKLIAEDGAGHTTSQSLTVRVTP